MTYERFTERAKKVMLLANQEAQQFVHEHVGTEHLLLGLIAEGNGVAANVLKNFDLDLQKIRHEVEKLTPKGASTILLGRLPLTSRTKRVQEYALAEAANTNHNYAGTEHLLLGLLREPEGKAAQVLTNLGLQLDEIRRDVLSLLGYEFDEAGTILADGDGTNEELSVRQIASYLRIANRMINKALRKLED
jgi:ATP-dependent Clp protease ATP-binding subunit ClpC